MAASGNTGFGALDAGTVSSLIELLDGDREALGEIVDAFVEEAPQRLTELRDGTASDDATLVARAAHTLKANGRTFGATALADLCEEIEAAARRGDLAPAAARVGDVDAAWQAIWPDLQALRSGTA